MENKIVYLTTIDTRTREYELPIDVSDYEAWCKACKYEPDDKDALLEYVLDTQIINTYPIYEDWETVNSYIDTDD